MKQNDFFLIFAHRFMRNHVRIDDNGISIRIRIFDKNGSEVRNLKIDKK